METFYLSASELFSLYLYSMKKIIAYKGYYAEFMTKLSEQERKKILRALLLFETENKIPHHYIKFIRDGIYEFIVNYGNNEFCSTVSRKRRRKRLKAR